MCVAGIIKKKTPSSEITLTEHHLHLVATALKSRVSFSIHNHHHLPWTHKLSHCKEVISYLSNPHPGPRPPRRACRGNKTRRFSEQVLFSPATKYLVTGPQVRTGREEKRKIEEKQVTEKKKPQHACRS